MKKYCFAKANHNMLVLLVDVIDHSSFVVPMVIEMNTMPIIRKLEVSTLI